MKHRIPNPSALTTETAIKLSHNKGSTACQLTALSCKILSAHLTLSLLPLFSRNERVLLPWSPSFWLFLSRRHDMWWKNKRNMRVESWFFFFQSWEKERLGFGSFLNLMKLRFVFVSPAFLHSRLSYQWEKLF